MAATNMAATNMGRASSEPDLESKFWSIRPHRRWVWPQYYKHYEYHWNYDDEYDADYDVGDD